METPTTLPDAAWFAEHVMGWQGKHAWNPLTNDADALMLWLQLPNPKQLQWKNEDLHTHECEAKIGYLIVDQVCGTGTFRGAICRAVAAWKGWEG